MQERGFTETLSAQAEYTAQANAVQQAVQLGSVSFSAVLDMGLLEKAAKTLKSLGAGVDLIQSAAATVSNVSEALVLATKAGADPEKVYQAIRGGLAGSTVLDAKAPMMLARNFQPGGKLSINMKDIKSVLATAHQAAVPLPLSAGLYEIMTALKNMGCLDNDHSGIVKYYERLAGVEVRPQ